MAKDISLKLLGDVEPNKKNYAHVSCQKAHQELSQEGLRVLNLKFQGYYYYYYCCYNYYLRLRQRNLPQRLQLLVTVTTIATITTSTVELNKSLNKSLSGI